MLLYYTILYYTTNHFSMYNHTMPHNLKEFGSTGTTEVSAATPLTMPRCFLKPSPQNPTIPNPKQLTPRRPRFSEAQALNPRNPKPQSPRSLQPKRSKASPKIGGLGRWRPCAQEPRSFFGMKVQEFRVFDTSIRAQELKVFDWKY